MFQEIDILDFNIILLFTTLILCLISGTILVVKNSKQKPTLFLGLFFGVQGLDAFGSIIEIVKSNPQWLFLPLVFDFLFVPILYLYAKNLTTVCDIKKEWKHLIPGAIEFLFFSFLFSLPSDIKLSIYTDPNMPILWIAFMLLNLLFSYYYLYKIYRLIKAHEIEVTSFYSSINGKMLGWMKPVIFFLGTCGLVWIISNVVYLLTDGELIDVFTSLLINSFNSGFIIWASIMGLRQVSLMDFVQMKATLNVPLTIPTIQNNKNQSNHNYQRLLDFMKEEEPYIDNNLTLSKLASELKIHPRTLSETIKKETQLNFNQFVNQYRIEKAKTLLLSPDYDNYSMLGIATAAGFNSKTTFNTTFKQTTSRTPSDFKRMYLNPS